MFEPVFHGDSFTKQSIYINQVFEYEKLLIKSLKKCGAEEVFSITPDKQELPECFPTLQMSEKGHLFASRTIFGVTFREPKTANF